MDFWDFNELATKVIAYEELLWDDNTKMKYEMGTYFKEAHHIGVEVAMVVVATTWRSTWPILVKPPVNSLQLKDKLGNPFTFDVSKTSEVFDFLIEYDFLTLLDYHLMPTK